MSSDSEVYEAIRAGIRLSDVDAASEAVLREHFPALVSVFLGYATATSPGRPPMLHINQLEVMLRDSQLLARHGSSISTEQLTVVWSQLAADGADPERPPAEPPPMDMGRFLEALLRLARPMAADPATVDPSLPPPPDPEPRSDRLKSLLDGGILPHANRDEASRFRDGLAADAARQRVLATFEPSLHQLFSRLVAASQIAAPRGQRNATALRNAVPLESGARTLRLADPPATAPHSSGPSSGQLGPSPRITPSAFAELLSSASLLGKVSVHAASAVTGDPRTKLTYAVELSAAEARRGAETQPPPLGGHSGPRRTPWLGPARGLSAPRPVSAGARAASRCRSAEARPAL